MTAGSLSEIAAFVAAAEASSFTEAARTRGMTRSGLAKSIARLEDRLEVRLFNRTTRSLSLTGEGRLFLDRCLQILADLEDAEHSLSQGGGEPQGLLRITAPATFGRLQILPVINAYLSDWPRVRIEASFTDRVSDIVEDGFDLAIRLGAPAEANSLISRRLASQHNRVVASPDYMENRRVPEHPDDLARHDCLNYVSGARVFAWHFQVEGELVTIRPRGRLMLDSGEALRDAALSGSGITYLPSYLVDADIAAGRLCELLGTYAAPPTAIVALYPSKRYLAPKVRRLIDLLVAELG